MPELYFDEVPKAAFVFDIFMILGGFRRQQLTTSSTLNKWRIIHA
jgi:hypothetical protein